MSKFKKGFKTLNHWDIKVHAINDYKERVTDDPIVARGCTAANIEKRLRSGLNNTSPDGAIPLDKGAIAYRTQFTKRGDQYYVIAKGSGNPRAVVAVWTQEILDNYKAGINSKGISIYDRE